ncbi:hypothetical protein JM654_07380 [Microbacterium oxydans]|nr:hypothetical protein [Microbacterium oxydans]
MLLRDGTTIGDSIVVLAAGTESTKLARGLGYKLPMQAGKGYSVRVRPEVPLRRPVYIPDAKAALTPTDKGLRIAGVMELGGRSLRIDGRRLSHMQQSAESYFAEGFHPGASHKWAGPSSRQRRQPAGDRSDPEHAGRVHRDRSRHVGSHTPGLSRASRPPIWCPEYNDLSSMRSHPPASRRNLTMTRTQVTELLDRFARGWKDLDGDQVTSCFVDSPATTVIGTDEGEHFEGVAGLRAVVASGTPPRT